MQRTQNRERMIRHSYTNYTMLYRHTNAHSNQAHSNLQLVG